MRGAAPTAPSGVGGVPAVGAGEELVSPMSGAAAAGGAPGRE